MKIRKIVRASYTPDHAEIVRQHRGLINIVDAQFDYPGWVEYGLEVSGDCIPAGLRKPPQVINGSFPRLLEILPGTHTLDGSGGLVPLDEPRRVGSHGIGLDPAEHVVYVDSDGIVWGVVAVNHYDPARATEVEIDIVDLATFRPWCE